MEIKLLPRNENEKKLLEEAVSQLPENTLFGLEKGTANISRWGNWRYNKN